MAFLTLRVRTFLVMLFIVVMAFVLTGIFSLFHFREEYKNYHFERLERKESAILSHLEYKIKPYQNQKLTTDQWSEVLAGVVEEIGNIHHLDVGIYAPSGNLVTGSALYNDGIDVLPDHVLPRVVDGVAKRFGRKVVEDTDDHYILSVSELLGKDNEVSLVVVIPYELAGEGIPEDDYEFLRELAWLYSVLFLIGVLLALFLSNYIANTYKVIGEKLKNVRLNRSNEKISWRYNDEIGMLIGEYNRMVEKLEETAVELAKSERESAWKEMAQQVAHEIKNPLTPMKLTLQMMERSKDLEDVKEMSRSLLEEVASLTHIAEAFSRFAQMPELVIGTEDVDSLTERTCVLYADRGVYFEGGEPAFAKVDREQWVRIIHNVIKNALQSVAEGVEPEVRVRVVRLNKTIEVAVADNGAGIPEDMKEKVFEPKFSTKSSGMGLGLAMVKNLVENFGGTIVFNSTAKGTTFLIQLPLEEPNTAA